MTGAGRGLAVGLVQSSGFRCSSPSIPICAPLRIRRRGRREEQGDSVDFGCPRPSAARTCLLSVFRSSLLRMPPPAILVMVTALARLR